MLQRARSDEDHVPARSIGGALPSQPTRRDAVQSSQTVARREGPDSRACRPDPREIVQVELSGRRCRLLLIDDRAEAADSAAWIESNAKVFDENVLTRFDFLGNHYALVAEPLRAQTMRDAADETAPAPDIRRLLTGRELQIVQLVCMGCLTKQIADRLRISEFTVRSYLKTIYCKLGVRSRAAMVFCYMKAMQRVDESVVVKLKT